MLSSRVRTASLSGLALGLTLLAGACASDSQAQTAATITIAPQSYQSKPAPTLEPQVTTPATAGEDGTTDQEQLYTVKAGDYPSTVAEKFEIPLQDLLNFNEWELEGNIVPEFPGPGGIVRIPSGAKYIDPSASDETDDGEDKPQPGDTTEDGAVIEATPEDVADDTSDRCVPGYYELENGDYPGKVAGKFDVSVDELAAANRNTPNYSAFIVGMDIIIPALEDC